MIEEIYDQYIDKVYGFFYYKTLNKQMSEDLTSDTFVIFMEKFNDEDVLIDDNKKYLYGVMRNVWLRYLQKKYKEAAVEIENIDDFSGHVEQTLYQEDLKDDKDRLRELIKQLPDKQQQVIKMRFIDELSLQEICNSLGKNMNYVKTTQKRGFKTMTRIIDNLAVSKGVSA